MIYKSSSLKPEARHKHRFRWLAVVSFLAGINGWRTNGILLCCMSLAWSTVEAGSSLLSWGSAAGKAAHACKTERKKRKRLSQIPELLLKLGRWQCGTGAGHIRHSLPAHPVTEAEMHSYKPFYNGWDWSQNIVNMQNRLSLLLF